jgi:hypothetical protein
MNGWNGKLESRTERFYQLLVQLQFKFLVSVFVCIMMLQVGAVLMPMPFPLNTFGMTLYYGVYIVGVYALSLFREHKRILDNPELYIPDAKPPKYNDEVWQIINSNVLTDREMQILYEWARGRTWKDLGLHPTTLNRILRKYIHESLKKVDVEENEQQRKTEKAKVL